MAIKVLYSKEPVELVGNWQPVEPDGSFRFCFEDTEPPDIRDMEVYYVQGRVRLIKADRLERYLETGVAE